MNDLLDALNHTFLGSLAAFGLGLLWGSFFNVCIVRIPNDEGLVFERSHCPKCQDPIPWYLNIPVLSYLWLRGRCRKCHELISIQYPLVEVASGILFLGLAEHFGWSLHFLAYALFVSALLVISVIDFHHQIIPDEISLPGIGLGFLFCFVTRDITWYQSLIGALAGGGVFFLIAYLYEKSSGREGLGGGDVKLLAMIGAWLGYQSLLLVIVISSFLGSVVGIACMAIQKKDFKAAIPFGPFLALAALIYFIWRIPMTNFLFPELP